MADPPDEADARRPRPAMRSAVWVALLLGTALCGGGLFSCAARFFEDPEPPPDVVTVVRPTPDVVVAMRDLARLETAEFHMERVIDLRERQARMFGLVEAEDAILLVAAGEVQAGVDLSDLRESDVTVDWEARTATILLPPVRVFDTHLDNDRTFVHSRTTDTFARRNHQLETQARQEAERTLESGAVEAGILERAEVNAERTVRSLVTSLGYRDVTVQFRNTAEEAPAVIAPSMQAGPTIETPR